MTHSSRSFDTFILAKMIAYILFTTNIDITEKFLILRNDVDHLWRFQKLVEQRQEQAQEQTLGTLHTAFDLLRMFDFYHGFFVYFSPANPKEADKWIYCCNPVQMFSVWFSLIAAKAHPDREALLIIRKLFKVE